MNLENGNTKCKLEGWHLSATVSVALNPVYRFLAVLLRVAAENVTDRQTYGRTDGMTNQVYTITLAVHARQGLKTQ